MYQLTTTANLVDYPMLENRDAIAAVLVRSELEAVVHAEGSPGIWFEIERGEDEVLALDGDAIAGLFDDPEVEAHGMRGALAIAVTSAAIVAPASLAASPQPAGVSTAQVSSLVAKTHIAKPGVARPGVATQQVAKTALKTQVARSLVLRAAGVQLLQVLR